MIVSFDGVDDHNFESLTSDVWMVFSIASWIVCWIWRKHCFHLELKDNIRNHHRRPPTSIENSPQKSPKNYKNNGLNASW